MFLFCHTRCSLALALKVEPEGLACFSQLKAETTLEINPPAFAVPMWFVCMCSVQDSCFLARAVLPCPQKLFFSLLEMVLGYLGGSL